MNIVPVARRSRALAYCAHPGTLALGALGPLDVLYNFTRGRARGTRHRAGYPVHLPEPRLILVFGLSRVYVVGTSELIESLVIGSYIPH